MASFHHNTAELGAGAGILEQCGLTHTTATVPRPATLIYRSYSKTSFLPDGPNLSVMHGLNLKPSRQENNHHLHSREASKLNELGSGTVLDSLRVSKNVDLPQGRFWIRADYPEPCKQGTTAISYPLLSNGIAQPVQDDFPCDFAEPRVNLDFKVQETLRLQAGSMG
ncbi:hypothetical protein Bbelb_218310 [Branchiostoma belcheri]|nr:hypothetical protein Bbelb_218310 [Branchiostoma belcheri]